MLSEFIVINSRNERPSSCFISEISIILISLRFSYSCSSFSAYAEEGYGTSAGDNAGDLETSRFVPDPCTYNMFLAMNREKRRAKGS